MPRFYLHVCNGNGFVEDEEGSDLPDASAAREKALAGARDIMAAEIQLGELDLGSFIEVEDENRNYLFTVTFAHAVDLKGQDQTAPSEGLRDRA
ncbi:hypothetical protein SH591_13930 [Sphingomonas sp. LY54]|uniref:DUF6894 family protein n=1 Tax=Sphingomonas sp. LY54 TaxID=3095343 RepID=UPI002D7A3E1A|nr:hypothetical protein [Sphingomonas sp. LY54]WRP28187.1 hypothetical protein SH591_13930 [Sphingomonas sp. LY54]